MYCDKTGHEKEGKCEAACTQALDERRCDLKREPKFLLKEAMSEDEQDKKEREREGASRSIVRTINLITFTLAFKRPESQGRGSLFWI